MKRDCDTLRRNKRHGPTETLTWEHINGFVVKEWNRCHVKSECDFEKEKGKWAYRNTHINGFVPKDEKGVAQNERVCVFVPYVLGTSLHLFGMKWVHYSCRSKSHRRKVTRDFRLIYGAHKWICCTKTVTG